MMKLRNYQNKDENVDRLHRTLKNSSENRCPVNICLGSKMSTPFPPVSHRTAEDVKAQATEFLDQYYSNLKRLKSAEHLSRLAEVYLEIDEVGTYELTFEELTFGAKLAWRNAVRCIGRIQWSKLKLFDYRHITTAREMFDAICEHIKYGTNQGNIRSVITVFPSRKHGKGDFRVWNQQLVNYAGYRNPDGTITGDSNNLELTEVCLKLGWQSKRTKWDILPMVLSANGNDPEIFDIPSDIIMQIPITHPKFQWFADLKIQWYALPAVSGMLFDCGGVEFPGCPFNGWYMGTEIGCRNLADVHRYNYLEMVAKRMGLSTQNPTTLWKDQALVEINIAVLHSFQKYGVTIMDHHTASESFMRHLDNENKSRGGCPSDWVWIVPPMSGSVTPVFHQEMAMYFLKPSYEYQEMGWKTHQWKDPKLAELFKKRDQRKIIPFRVIAPLIKLTTGLFHKHLHHRIDVTILYATETGKSEGFAKILHRIFLFSFNPSIYVMSEYDVSRLSSASIVLVVASTFGNGDPPENGEKFFDSLHTLKNSPGEFLVKKTIKSGKNLDVNNNDEKILHKSDTGIHLDSIFEDDAYDTTTVGSSNLDNTWFSVFALGSTAYPNYCEFGYKVDDLLSDLGGNRLLNVACGNELRGQDDSFQDWCSDIFNETCKQFSVTVDESTMAQIKAINVRKPIPAAVRFVPAAKENITVGKELSRIHNRNVGRCLLTQRSDLHEPMKNTQTIKVVLKRMNGEEKMEYKPGDHIGIVPKNSPENVNYILTRLHTKPKADKKITLQAQFKSEKENPQWENVDSLPTASLREMLTMFLDIETPVEPSILRYFASCATNVDEKQSLTKLAEDKHEYENWREWYCPNLVTVLKQFPSVLPDAMTLCSKLPMLQPRFYSVSSSPLVHPDEMHLTVGVLKYQTRNGAGPWNYGVCSNYLNDTPIGESIYCFVRNAPSFHLPEDSSKPLILIGPGTGIAPLRGFWEERHYLLQHRQNQKFGKASLYFGCQTSKMLLYQDELDRMTDSNVINDVYVALSREKFIMKMYVQDLLKQKNEEIMELLEKGAHIYVCGNCIMADDVFRTIKSIVKNHKGLSEVESESYMRLLKSENRYHIDVFGASHKVAKTSYTKPSVMIKYDNFSIEDKRIASRPGVKLGKDNYSPICCAIN